jgi:hypothetical protein
MNKTQLTAALKEVARLIICAIPAILIQALTNDPALVGTYGAPLLLILRAVDKAIHEDKSIATKGIIPF